MAVAMAESIPSVAVVMSTYNGERYLADQIDSVLLQDLPGVRLYVRDDGSSDGTVGVLRCYEEQGLLTLVCGENRGVAASFIAALAMPPNSCPYVAFCDQDDVWHPDKLRRALEVLSGCDQSIPQLYCSEYNFCDEQLRFTGRSHLNRIGVGFETMLMETVVSGNTCVMNRTLVDELIANGTEGVYVHDWWVGLVAATLGEVHFDDIPSLEYRRADDTFSPTGQDSPLHNLELLRFRLRKFFRDGQLDNIVAQLKHLRERYASRMSDEQLALIDRVIDGGRLSKLALPVRLRQKLYEEIAVRVLFALGLI